MYKKIQFVLTFFVFAMIFHLNAFGLTASQETFVNSFNNAGDQSTYANSIPLPYDDCSDSYTGINDPHPIKESTVIINNTDCYPDMDAYSFYPTTSEEFVFSINASNSVTIEITDIEDNILYEFCAEDVLESEFIINLPFDYFYTIKVIGYSNYAEYQFYLLPVTDDYGNDTESSSEIQIGSIVTGNLISTDDIDYFSFVPEKTGAYKLNLVSPHCYNLIITDSNGEQIHNLACYFNLTRDQKYYIKVWNEDSSKVLSYYDFSITGPLEEDYGDTISTSQSVYTNQNIQGSIYHSGDYDIFSFNATSIYCILEVKGVPYKNIELYDSSNNLVICYDGIEYISATKNLAIDEVAIQHKSIVCYDNLQVGSTYFLKIGGDTDPTPYTFTIKSSLDGYNDNSYIFAKTIDVATPVTGNINSYHKDVFRFIPKLSGTYSINFLDILHLDFSVFDFNSYSYLDPIFSTQVNSSRYNYELEKGKTYYIFIYPYYETEYSFIIDGPLPTPEVKIGDVNGDNSINSIDFANLRMFLLGMINTFPSPLGQDAADINQDGSINSIDFAILRQYLLGIIDTL
ncbi:dockerin type I repeat-containing protein [Acetivibrio cellulolyticus]|uniref:dockerin type I repeat-containing protein n=1 Tax=Acetivibrio cellulolyticus TaxID=35830 RepID=UPI0001E301C2|nr:dockerin type I repeat-containing protein [Acetivibrio cellulolyticus]